MKEECYVRGYIILENCDRRIKFHQPAYLANSGEVSAMQTSKPI